LIVGGGNVAEEKLSFLKLAANYDVELIRATYKTEFLNGKHLVIATTDKPDINIQVYNDCRSMDKLVNVADNPPYCDFFMGGIVTKGNVKVAISTNGKSPTTAKRLRQFFEDVIPEDISMMVQNLNTYRKTIKGNFEQKVDKMNEVTETLVSNIEE
jgi:precorrin-2 dehydrogenase/sirohydrochlorin ferrochelatase